MAANPAFVEDVLDAYIAADAPVFKAMLVNSDYIPDPASEAGTETAATFEIAAVARVELTGVAVVNNDPEIGLLADSVVFLGLPAETTDVGGIVIYVEGATEADNVIVSWDLDEGPFDPPAGNLTYIVDPAGFAVFSV